MEFAYPSVDELLDTATGESPEEARPLAVAGHALEGPDLALPIKEHVHALAVDPDQHLPPRPRRPFPSGMARRGGPRDLVHLVRHRPLQLRHL